MFIRDRYTNLAIYVLHGIFLAVFIARSLTKVSQIVYKII